MLIVRGVNAWPNAIEAIIGGISGAISEFRIVVDREQNVDELVAEAGRAAGVSPAAAAAPKTCLEQRFKEVLMARTAVGSDRTEYLRRADVQNVARDRPAQPMNSQPAPGPGTGQRSIITLGQDRPDVAGTAFVAPGAVLIGRVTIGAEASVWYGAVLRADRDTISFGERSNVQDGCVLHADPGVPLSVGSEVTIGHNATLHGCTVEDLVLIGMGAIVLNGARVGRHSIIAAGTVLAEGQEVPEGVLVAGVPGKVRRDLSAAELAAIGRNAATYVALSQLHRRGGA